MIRSRFGLRAIGLCLALAGLMAVSASSAQAEVGAKWLVKGVTVTTLLPTLTGTLENSHGTLLGVIGVTPIHILCTAVDFVKVHLLAEGGILGRLKFLNCVINTLKEGKVVALPACTPPGGIVETVESKGLVRLHKLASGVVDTITLLEPNVGTLFTTITTSEECAFGELIKISGKLAVVDAAFLTDQVTHLITEFKELTKLFLNGNEEKKATIDGSAEVKLAEGHAGLTWACHPA